MPNAAGRVDDRQLPELREVHRLVEDALAQRALAEETDGDTAVLEVPGGERRAGRDARATANDGVSTEVAGTRVGNVHRPALPLAIAGFLSEQLGEHEVRLRTFRQAVAMPAVRAGDVVVRPKRLADANRHGFFPYI
jgi:hypothetical protein